MKKIWYIKTYYSGWNTYIKSLLSLLVLKFSSSQAQKNLFNYWAQLREYKAKEVPDQFRARGLLSLEITQCDCSLTEAARQ